MNIAGIVLAGGQSRRMGGGDKALRLLAGKPLIGHAIARAQPQVAALAISANGDPARFHVFGLPVLADSVPGQVGPLAGILAGLDWAAALNGISHVASFACDAPFFPLDLVARLADELERSGARLACAASGGRVHPVFGLWPLDIRDELRRALADEGLRKVDGWTARFPLATVEFAVGTADPFLNVNHPVDLAKAESLLASPPGGR
jgi:molybdenum cofactor guanylyltransferase